MAEVDDEIARLTALRVEMAAMAAALPSADCPPPEPGTWCPTVEGGDPMLELTCDCDPDCTDETCECGCC
jgi:hypothetical protein